jgi:hypothetical protein
MTRSSCVDRVLWLAGRRPQRARLPGLLELSLLRRRQRPLQQRRQCFLRAVAQQLQRPSPPTPDNSRSRHVTWARAAARRQRARSQAARAHGGRVLSLQATRARLAKHRVVYAQLTSVPRAPRPLPRRLHRPAQCRPAPQPAVPAPRHHTDAHNTATPTGWRPTLASSAADAS